MTSLQYNTVDIGKFIASIAIIALHIPPIGREHGIYSQAVDFLTSIAVPYFFGISSFLFFSKVNQLTQKAGLSALFHFVKRIALLYGMWLLLNTIFMNERNAEVWRSSFFVDLFLGNTFPGSWFYSALVTGVIICFYLRKLNNYMLLVAGLSVYFWFILCKENLWHSLSMYNWYEIHIFECFLSAPYAMVWIMMGAVISEFNRVERKKLLLMCNFIIICFSIMCVFLIPNGVNCISWIIRLLLVEGLLIATTSYNVKYTLPYTTMRKMSTLIFMVHFFFLYKISHNLLLGGWLSSKFIITTTATIMLSFVIVKLSDRYIILKYLY